jgi:hypothetical protein
MTSQGNFAISGNAEADNRLYSGRDFAPKAAMFDIIALVGHWRVWGIFGNNT